jgi:hypothetical protein
MNNRTYERFVPHENNIDTVDAADINELQRTLEKAQEELFVQADASFLHKALFTLEHHPDTNTMFVDLMEDSSKFNISSMQHVSYSEEMNSISLDGVDQSEGSVITKALINSTGKAYRKIVLLTDEHKPQNSGIEYSISFDGVKFLQIQANQAIPAITQDEMGQVYMKIRFTRQDFTTSPRVDAWALLYEDETYKFRFLDDGLDIGIESGWDGTIIK